MDSQDYCVYLGNLHGRRPLKSIAINEWDCVFSGSHAKCKNYIREHPFKLPLQYIIAEANYTPSETIQRPILHRDTIATIEKITLGGMHVCVHSFHHDLWQFKIQMASGDEGYLTHNRSELPARDGNEVLYTIQKQFEKTIITIKTILG